MIRTLQLSTAFARDLKSWLKTHPLDATAIQATMDQLSLDASEPSLRTHKLKGKYAGSWACSVGYDLRIVFEFRQRVGTEEILLLSIGTHDQVY